METSERDYEKTTIDRSSYGSFTISDLRKAFDVVSRWLAGHEDEPQGGTMKIYNNNPAFGDCGPFDSEAPTFRLACFELANEMQPNFETFADAQEYSEDDTEEEIKSYRREHIAMQRRTFIDGLTQIIHCDECGQDYHEDAPERGHADGCSKR